MGTAADAGAPRAGDSRPALPRARPLALCALVAVCAVAPYLNSLGGDFTFDDPMLVRDNPMIHRDPALALLRAVYYPGALYRPLTMLSYAANHSLGEAAFGYHVVNVALHALVSVLVFALARRVLRSVFAAFAAAALFALHPIHTEAVSGIVGRAELLAALGVLTSILALLRALRRTGAAAWAWGAASLAAFAAGLLSKESALTAVPMLALVAWWVHRPPLRRLALRLLPYIAIGLAYLGLRLAVVGSLGLPAPPPPLDNPLAHVPATERVATALVILLEYLSQLLVPVQLSADYSLNQIPVVTSPTDTRFLLAVTVFAALALGLIGAARRAPALVLAACLTALPLALTANLLFPIGTIRAERLLYLPSVGWCLALGWTAARARRRHHALTAAGVAVLALGFAGRTWTRNWDWRDNLALFTAAVRTSPASAKAHYNLGVAYEQHGDLDAAVLHLRQALTICPSYVEAAFAVGAVYERRGIDAGALHWYARAMQLDWSFAKAHLNTGVVRYRRGEFAGAEAAFRTGLAAAPEDPRLLIGLSLALGAQQRLVESRLVLAAVDAATISDADVLEYLELARLATAESPAPGRWAVARAGWAQSGAASTGRTSPTSGAMVATR